MPCLELIHGTPILPLEIIRKGLHKFHVDVESRIKKGQLLPIVLFGPHQSSRWSGKHIRIRTSERGNVSDGRHGSYLERARKAREI